MDRKEFYFRELVTEDDLNSACDNVEAADHNITVDSSIFQKVDGSNAPLSTPAGTDFNALLGGIVNGLTITLGGSGTTAVIASGTAYDSQGNRIYVPTTVNVLLTTTGTTSIGLGGTPGGVGSISTVPASGQFTWVLLQVFFNRNLSDPREDGNDMTVYFDSAESFQFKVKVSSSSSTPAIPAGDPGCIILGAFKMNDTPNITVENFTTRGDWLRTYAVYTAGTLPTEQFEDGTLTDAAFIAGTPRQAILKLRNTIGLSTTNYTNHINQGAPQDRHAAKNIDFDATSGIGWADGTTPALGTNLGGGIDADGVQSAIGTLVSTIAGTTTGFGGTKFLGGASITGSPVTLAAGTIRSQLTSILTGLNNHLNATTAAHAATAISATAGTVFTGTDVGTQLGQIDSYINGRVTTAISITGSNVVPIWRYKNARNYAGFGIDHQAMPGGRIMEIRENWVGTNSSRSAIGASSLFQNWSAGLFGTSTGGIVQVEGPAPSSPANYPAGPLMRLLAGASSGSNAAVMEMNSSVLTLALQYIMMDFDFSINTSAPRSNSDFMMGFGDGTLISGAAVGGVGTTGADPFGAYFLAAGGGSFNITVRTKASVSPVVTTSGITLAAAQPHRARIEIVPAAFSDTSGHQVNYYLDGAIVDSHAVDMTATTPFPFFRASCGGGTPETSVLSIGPVRIQARLANGDVFI